MSYVTSKPLQLSLFVAIYYIWELKKLNIVPQADASMTIRIREEAENLIKRFRIMIHVSTRNMEQAGTGPSRGHIQGSKIAKGHQSFKVFSSTALKNFFEKSLAMPKKN